MGFWSDFGNGIASHIRAISFISKHNLWAYFIVPLFITLALTMIGFFGIGAIGDGLGKWMADKLNLFPSGESDWGKIFGYIVGFFAFVISHLMKWILYFLFLKLLRYVVLILCSPIMAALSKRVDEIHTGHQSPFVFSEFLHDIVRGILVVFRSFFFETIILIGLFILFCLPIIGWLILPFMWINGWYFLGFNMMDYTYERRRMKISEGAQFTRKHKGIAIGNGMVYSFLLWIPIIGICIAPVLSSVAATLATTETLEKK